MNIFVLTGAGVSAESGLGTFRDKAGTGIWARSTTRAAILIRRRRKVSNCATRHCERLGIRERRLHSSQYAPACRKSRTWLALAFGQDVRSWAGRAIGGKVRLPRLDVVLRRAAPAVELFIKHTRVACGQARDDEAGVCSVGAGLDARDDALDPAPAGGAVVELRVTARLARLRGGDIARHRAGFQALDMPAQGRGRRNAEDEVNPVGATPVEDLRAAIVAVGAQQDRRCRPVGPDGPEHPAQEGADFRDGVDAPRRHRGAKVVVLTATL